MGFQRQANWHRAAAARLMPDEMRNQQSSFTSARSERVRARLMRDVRTSGLKRMGTADNLASPLLDRGTRASLARFGPGGLGSLPTRGSHRPVRARIRAYGSSDHGLAAC